MNYLQCAILFLLLILFSCKQDQLARASIAPAEEQIAAVLQEQVRAWNRGDIAGYMDGYLASDSLRFASGGKVNFGWQTVLERYRQRYSSPTLMGKLSFDRLDIRLLGPESGMAFGRWQLQRDSDRPWGLFTLILQKTPEGWRIIHDHTSSGEGDLSE